MSKVISFSISDRYLDKLRSLYPHLTDNLAVKQFVTDGLDSSLGSSLDGNLDGDLDGKLKTIIETSLDGLLDERLDAVMGKLISSLSERMARLEERLDDSLDGRLDEMELLLKREREASITSLIPTGEPSHFPTIGETPNMEPVATVEIADTVESVYDKVETADTVEAVTDTVEAIDEPVTGSIGPVPGEGDSIDTVKGKGMTAKAAVDYLETKRVTVSYASLHRWRDGVSIPNTSPQGRDVRKHLILRDKLYYPID